MSEGANHDIYTDHLFVGLTRPTTVLGIPDTALIAELVVVIIIFIGANNPLYMGLIIPLHSVLYLISAHDAGAFHNLWIWANTTSLSSRNIKFWGAASFSPLPLKKWKK